MLKIILRDSECFISLRFDPKAAAVLLAVAQQAAADSGRQLLHDRVPNAAAAHLICLLCLQTAKDVFGDVGILTVEVGAGEPQSLAVVSNSTWQSASEDKTVSFVGRKGNQTLEFAPFRVGPPKDIVLNNLVCTPELPAALPGTEGPAGTVSKAQPGGYQSSYQPLQVEYMPIEYTSDAGSALFSSSFTQFYFKITSVGGQTLPVGNIMLQYWFNGPEEAVDTSQDADSNSEFKLYCSDLTRVRAGAAAAAAAADQRQPAPPPATSIVLPA